MLEPLFSKVAGLTAILLFNIAEFFDRKPPVASVNLLFLIKSNVGWFLLKRVDLVIVCIIYTLLVENFPTRFSWLTCRNQKLVQSKPQQQRLFVLVLSFWQCRQVFVHYLMSIIIICKLTHSYIYQVASWEFPFARTCSEKENICLLLGYAKKKKKKKKKKKNGNDKANAVYIRL